MKQKLFILFVLCLCIQHITYCQAPPCKYQINDGKTIITDSASGWIVYGNIQIIKTGSDYKLHLKFTNTIAQNTPPYKIVKGQLFRIALRNKDTVSLAANETKTGTVLHDPHLSSSFVVDEYNISSADIKRILTSPCVGVQINYSMNDDSARNMDIVHNLLHNLFINLLNCAIKG